MRAGDAAVLLAILALAPAASARVLAVGPGQEFAAPSLAAKVAQDGDLVSIEPGTYYDCSTWRAAHLSIQGHGDGVVLTDVTCQGKAILILDGDDASIRNLTLARARVPDRNGAGIRLETPSVTLENVRFINDEVGLLAGAPAPGRIRITDCLFEAGGVGQANDDAPTYAIMVGPAALLQVERSTIRGVKGGGISTSAAYAVLNGNAIGVGTGEGAQPAVQATAGGLLMQDNVITLGPRPPVRAAAVWAVEIGETILRRNRLINQTGQPATLLLDWTTGSPAMEANVVGRGDTELSSSGRWRFVASTMAHGTIAWAHGLAGDLRHLAGNAKRQLLGP